jgi:hypothetical protein
VTTRPHRGSTFGDNAFQSASPRCAPVNAPYVASVCEVHWRHANCVYRYVDYTTFPTIPPKSRGRPPSDSPSGQDGNRSEDGSHNHHESPLPTKQLIVLAVIALAEQTALNSISPYLPEMTKSFPEVKDGQTGLYVGLIASSFALAQFTTNFFWGWLSDKIGRKPVIIMGTFLTMCCFLAFGFCRELWQAILVQALMGFVNGNNGVVSTCLGEITDRSNQSRAFTCP